MRRLPGLINVGRRVLGITKGGTGASTQGTARTALGVGTGDSPQFTAVNIGHASDTTLARASAGNLTVEGNALYRAGGTDVAIGDGGTGASTAAAARAALGVKGSLDARFRAALANDQNIPADTITDVDFVENADIGNFFATGGWMPPAGDMIIGVTVTIKCIIACTASVYVIRDGSDVYAAQISLPVNGIVVPVSFTYSQAVTGAEDFEIGVYATEAVTLRKTENLRGNALCTFYWGQMSGGP